MGSGVGVEVGAVVAVGCGVDDGVGTVVAVGTDVAVGSGFDVGSGVAVGICVAVGIGVFVGLAGAAVGAAVGVAVLVAIGLAVGVVAKTTSLFGVGVAGSLEQPMTAYAINMATATTNAAVDLPGVQCEGRVISKSAVFANCQSHAAGFGA